LLHFVANNPFVKRGRMSFIRFTRVCPHDFHLYRLVQVKRTPNSRKSPDPAIVPEPRLQ
jgi:hypothetical protein